MSPELLPRFKPFVSLEFNRGRGSSATEGVFLFLCSFNDVKLVLCVNHLLFAKDRDVESDGAHPFQHLRIPNALLPPQWQKDKLICGVTDAVVCGFKDPPRLY